MFEVYSITGANELNFMSCFFKNQRKNERKIKFYMEHTGAFWYLLNRALSIYKYICVCIYLYALLPMI